MMSDKNFPWGTVKQIHKMGLVQKDRLEYVKSSVNRLTCVSTDEIKTIMLTEYKAQSSPDRARLEQDCIGELRMTNRMDKESIFCEFNSGDPDQFEFISDEKNLCRILHHAVTYKKDHCLHAVRNTKLLMSCTKVNFVSELTEAYQKTLEFLYNSVLEPFYAGASAHKDLSGTEVC